MTTYVKQVMSGVVACIEPDYTIEELERIIDLHQVHCLPVIDNREQCVGVVSMPDLIHWHHIKHRCEELQAWEICTHQIIEVNPHMSVREASKIMVENNIHHLVVTQNNELVGIISTMDIIKFLVEEA